MKKHRILSAILAGTLVIGGTAGVAAAVRLTTGGVPVTVVSAGELMSGDYHSDSMEGTIQTSGSQMIYLSDSEKVSEIKVKPGDQVKAGDPVLLYDTQQTSLNYETEKLNLQKLQLQIQTAEQNLKLLAQKRPSVSAETAEDPSDSGRMKEAEEETGVQAGSEQEEDIGAQENRKQEQPSDPDDVQDGNPIEEPADFGEITLHTQLDENSSPFFDQNAEPGSEANPYRFLVKDGSRIQAGFFRRMEQLKKTEDGSCFVEIEIRRGDTVTGTLKYAWMQNIAGIRFSGIPAAWEGTLSSDSATGFIIAASALPEKEKAGQQEDEKGQDPEEADSHAAEPEEEQAGPSAPQAEGSSLIRPIVGELAGTSKVKTAENGTKEAGERATEPAGGSLIPASASFTAEELEEEKKNQNSQLEELRLSEREQQLKIQKAQKALQGGKIVALSDGIVKKVGDPKNPPKDGTPFIEISGTHGATVRGGIDERRLDEIRIGQVVTVISWESGMHYSAKIDDISPYPDTSGMYGYGSGATSYYPFTAHLLDSDAEVKNMESVEIRPEEENAGEADLQKPETDLFGMLQEGIPGEAFGPVDQEAPEEMESFGQETDGSMEISKAFVRLDASKPYVMVRDEKKRLKKKEVQVVSQSADGCRIIGVTAEDYLAFPYGKRVKEGARTKEGSLSDLYQE